MKRPHLSELGAWAFALALLLVTGGCHYPDDDDFNVNDDDDDDDTTEEDDFPEPLSEGVCHLEGSFFRSDTTFGQLTDNGGPGAGYDAISCDFGDGEEEYYLDTDSVDWMANPTIAALHAGGYSVAQLNGGIHGLTPVIYVGGVNTTKQEVYLWMSFHGVGTYWSRSSAEDQTLDCTVIWSWNIDDSRSGVPVVAELDDYCDTSPYMYTGHGTDTCKFGFFPLGAYHVMVAENDGFYQLNSVSLENRKVEYFDFGASQLNDLEGTATEGLVDAAIDNTYFAHFRIQAQDFLGDEVHARQSNDSLKGIDWEGEVSTSQSEDYDYITRTDKFSPSPEDFIDDIAAVQSSLHSWTSNCGS